MAHQKTSYVNREYPKHIRVFTALFVGIFTFQTLAWATPGGFQSLAQALPSKPGLFETLARDLEKNSLVHLDKKFIPDAGASDTPFVIHIRDLHSNPEAQRKIAEILEVLKKSGVDQVALEGAFTTIHPEYLKHFPSDELNQKLASDLIDEGELTGAELFSTKQESRGAEFRGADDLALYRQSYEAFQKVKSSKAKLSEIFKTYDQKMEALETKTLSADLQELLHHKRDWDGQKNNFEHYFKTLKALAKKHLNRELGDAGEQFDWPALTRFAKVQEMESNLKTELVHKELEDLKETLKKILPSPQPSPLGGEGDISKFPSPGGRGQGEGLLLGLEKLIKNQKEFQTWIHEGGFDPKFRDARVFFEKLYEATQTKKMSLLAFPQFMDYAGILILQDEIKSEVLFKEFEKLDAELRNTLAKQENEKKILSLGDELSGFKKLLTLTMSRQDWNDFQGRFSGTDVAQAKRIENFQSSLHSHPELMRTVPENLSRELGVTTPVPSELIQIAKNFYELSLKRDQILVEKSLSSKTKNKAVVLIAGGFHSEGIETILKSKNIPYLILSPQVHEALNEKLYDDVMSGTQHLVKALLTIPSFEYQTALGLGNEVRTPLQRAELRIEESNQASNNEASPQRTNEEEEESEATSEEQGSLFMGVLFGTLTWGVIALTAWILWKATHTVSKESSPSSSNLSLRAKGEVLRQAQDDGEQSRTTISKGKAGLLQSVPTSFAMTNKVDFTTNVISGRNQPPAQLRHELRQKIQEESKQILAKFMFRKPTDGTEVRFKVDDKTWDVIESVIDEVAAESNLPQTQKRLRQRVTENSFFRAKLAVIYEHPFMYGGFIKDDPMKTAANARAKVKELIHQSITDDKVLRFIEEYMPDVTRKMESGEKVSYYDWLMSDPEAYARAVVVFAAAEEKGKKSAPTRALRNKIRRSYLEEFIDGALSEADIAILKAGLVNPEIQPTEYQIGESTFFQELLDKKTLSIATEIIDAFHRGQNNLEIPVDLLPFRAVKRLPDEVSKAERAKIKALAKLLGVTLTVHSPIVGPQHPKTGFSQLLEDTADNPELMKEVIDFSGDIGAKVIVVHIALPENDDALDQYAQQVIHAKGLKAWDGTPLQIGFENYYFKGRKSPYEYLTFQRYFSAVSEIVKKVAAKDPAALRNISMVLDSAHFNLVANLTDPLEAAFAVRENIEKLAESLGAALTQANYPKEEFIQGMVAEVHLNENYGPTKILINQPGKPEHDFNSDIHADVEKGGTIANDIFVIILLHQGFRPIILAEQKARLSEAGLKFLQEATRSIPREGAKGKKGEKISIEDCVRRGMAMIENYQRQNGPSYDRHRFLIEENGSHKVKPYLAYVAGLDANPEEAIKRFTEHLSRRLKHIRINSHNTSEYDDVLASSKLSQDGTHIFEYPAGYMLMKRGQTYEQLVNEAAETGRVPYLVYILKAGRLHVSVQSDTGERKELGVLEAGEMVGEGMVLRKNDALEPERVRNADVVVGEGGAMLLGFTETGFENLNDGMEPLAERIEHNRAIRDVATKKKAKEWEEMGFEARLKWIINWFKESLKDREDAIQKMMKDLAARYPFDQKFSVLVTGNNGDILPLVIALIYRKASITLLEDVSGDNAEVQEEYAKIKAAIPLRAAEAIGNIHFDKKSLTHLYEMLPSKKTKEDHEVDFASAVHAFPELQRKVDAFTIPADTPFKSIQKMLADSDEALLKLLGQLLLFVRVGGTLRLSMAEKKLFVPLIAELGVQVEDLGEQLVKEGVNAAVFKIVSKPADLKRRLRKNQLLPKPNGHKPVRAELRNQTPAQKKPVSAIVQDLNKQAASPWGLMDKLKTVLAKPGTATLVPPTDPDGDPYAPSERASIQRAEVRSIRKQGAPTPKLSHQAEGIVTPKTTQFEDVLAALKVPPPAQPPTMIKGNLSSDVAIEIKGGAVGMGRSDLQIVVRAVSLNGGTTYGYLMFPESSLLKAEVALPVEGSQKKVIHLVVLEKEWDSVLSSRITKTDSRLKGFVFVNQEGKTIKLSSDSLELKIEFKNEADLKAKAVAADTPVKKLKSLRELFTWASKSPAFFKYAASAKPPYYTSKDQTILIDEQQVRFFVNSTRKEVVSMFKEGKTTGLFFEGEIPESYLTYSLDQNAAYEIQVVSQKKGKLIALKIQLKVSPGDYQKIKSQLKERGLKIETFTAPYESPDGYEVSLSILQHDKQPSAKSIAPSVGTTDHSNALRSAPGALPVVAKDVLATSKSPGDHTTEGIKEPLAFLAQLLEKGNFFERFVGDWFYQASNLPAELERMSKPSEAKDSFEKALEVIRNLGVVNTILEGHRSDAVLTAAALTFIENQLSEGVTRAYKILDREFEEAGIRQFGKEQGLLIAARLFYHISHEFSEMIGNLRELRKNNQFEKASPEQLALASRISKIAQGNLVASYLSDREMTFKKLSTAVELAPQTFFKDSKVDDLVRAIEKDVVTPLEPVTDFERAKPFWDQIRISQEELSKLKAERLSYLKALQTAEALRIFKDNPKALYDLPRSRDLVSVEKKIDETESSISAFRFLEYAALHAYQVQVFSLPGSPSYLLLSGSDKIPQDFELGKNHGLKFIRELPAGSKQYLFQDVQGHVVRFLANPPANMTQVTGLVTVASLDVSHDGPFYATFSPQGDFILTQSYGGSLSIAPVTYDSAGNISVGKFSESTERGLFFGPTRKEAEYSSDEAWSSRSMLGVVRILPHGEAVLAIRDKISRSPELFVQEVLRDKQGIRLAEKPLFMQFPFGEGFRPHLVVFPNGKNIAIIYDRQIVIGTFVRDDQNRIKDIHWTQPYKWDGRLTYSRSIEISRDGKFIFMIPDDSDRRDLASIPVLYNQLGEVSGFGQPYFSSDKQSFNGSFKVSTPFPDSKNVAVLDMYGETLKVYSAASLSGERKSQFLVELKLNIRPLAPPSVTSDGRQIFIFDTHRNVHFYDVTYDERGYAKEVKKQTTVSTPQDTFVIGPPSADGKYLLAAADESYQKSGWRPSFSLSVLKINREFVMPGSTVRSETRSLRHSPLSPRAEARGQQGKKSLTPEDSIFDFFEGRRISFPLYDMGVHTFAELQGYSAEDLMLLLSSWEDIDEINEKLKATGQLQLPENKEYRKPLNRPLTLKDPVWLLGLTGALGVSVRARKLLANAKIKTIGDLQETFWRGLHKFRNAGKLTIRFLNERLAANGFPILEGIPPALRIPEKRQGETTAIKRLLTAEDPVELLGFEKNNLGTRVQNILESADIATIGKLQSKSYYEIDKYRNAGKLAISYLNERLITNGLPPLKGTPGSLLPDSFKERPLTDADDVEYLGLERDEYYSLKYAGIETIGQLRTELGNPFLRKTKVSDERFGRINERLKRNGFSPFLLETDPISILDFSHEIASKMQSLKKIKDLFLQTRVQLARLGLNDSQITQINQRFTEAGFPAVRPAARKSDPINFLGDSLNSANPRINLISSVLESNHIKRVGQLLAKDVQSLETFRDGGLIITPQMITTLNERLDANGFPQLRRTTKKWESVLLSKENAPYSRFRRALLDSSARNKGYLTSALKQEGSITRYDKVLNVLSRLKFSVPEELGNVAVSGSQQAYERLAKFVGRVLYEEKLKALKVLYRIGRAEMRSSKEPSKIGRKDTVLKSWDVSNVRKLLHTIPEQSVFTGFTVVNRERRVLSIAMTPESRQSLSPTKPLNQRQWHYEIKEKNSEGKLLATLEVKLTPKNRVKEFQIQEVGDLSSEQHDWIETFQKDFSFIKGRTWYELKSLNRVFPSPRQEIRSDTENAFFVENNLGWDYPIPEFENAHDVITKGFARLGFKEESSRRLASVDSVHITVVPSFEIVLIRDKKRMKGVVRIQDNFGFSISKTAASLHSIDMTAAASQAMQKVRQNLVHRQQSPQDLTLSTFNQAMEIPFTYYSYMTGDFRSSKGFKFSVGKRVHMKKLDNSSVNPNFFKVTYSMHPSYGDEIGDGFAELMRLMFPQYTAKVDQSRTKRKDVFSISFTRHRAELRENSAEENAKALAKRRAYNLLKMKKAELVDAEKHIKTFQNWLEHHFEPSQSTQKIIDKIRAADRDSKKDSGVGALIDGLVSISKKQAEEGSESHQSRTELRFDKSHDRINLRSYFSNQGRDLGVVIRTTEIAVQKVAPELPQELQAPMRKALGFKTSVKAKISKSINQPGLGFVMLDELPETDQARIEFLEYLKGVLIQVPQAQLRLVSVNGSSLDAQALNKFSSRTMPKEISSRILFVAVKENALHRLVASETQKAFSVAKTLSKGKTVSYQGFSNRVSVAGINQANLEHVFPGVSLIHFDAKSKNENVLASQILLQLQFASSVSSLLSAEKIRQLQELSKTTTLSIERDFGREALNASTRTLESTFQAYQAVFSAA